MFAACIPSLRRVAVACAPLVLLTGIVSAAVQDSSGNAVTTAAQPAAVTPVTLDFGRLAVGATISRSNIAVRFSRAGEIAQIRGLVQGAENLDYQLNDGTCTPGAQYQAGESCTVAVTFQPLYPGRRNGAVVLTNKHGATLATTFLTGLGEGAMATFPNATTLPIAPNVGFFSHYAVDGNDNIFYVDGQQILRITPSGASSVFLTIPSPFEDPMLGTMDGAGNLILLAGKVKGNHIRPDVLRVDPSGNITRVATITVSSPAFLPVSLASVAALGNGDLLVGSSGAPGYEVYLYVVHPNGLVDVRFGLFEKYANTTVSDLAVGPTGTIYEGSYGWIYQSTKELFINAYTDGMDVDASGTLLTGSEQGYLGVPQQPCPTPSIPGGCGSNPAPPVNQLPFKFPVVDAKGDAFVIFFANPTSPLYKLVRTQPSGVVFSSSGTGTSYGSFAITNSGNQPLDLSQLNPVLGGAAPQAFHIDHSSCGASLAPAATCSISLSYTPTGLFPTLPTSASLLLGGLRPTSTVVPLEGFPNQ